MNAKRRRFLRTMTGVAWRGALALVAVAGAGPILGRVLRGRWRSRRRPDDLAPIPWIGHC